MTGLKDSFVWSRITVLSAGMTRRRLQPAKRSGKLAIDSISVTPRNRVMRLLDALEMLKGLIILEIRAALPEPKAKRYDAAQECNDC